MGGTHRERERERRPLPTLDRRCARQFDDVAGHDGAPKQVPTIPEDAARDSCVFDEFVFKIMEILAFCHSTQPV